MVNRLFARVNSTFVFKLQSVKRFQDTASYICNEDNFEQIGKKYRVGGPMDLNVYFCDFEIPDHPSTTGYGFPPFVAQAGGGSDGVFLNSNYTRNGIPAPDDFLPKKLLPHEVGHWLGLYHTFKVSFYCQ